MLEKILSVDELKAKLKQDPGPLSKNWCKINLEHANAPNSSSIGYNL